EEPDLPGGGAKKIELANGKFLSADLVLNAAGILANRELAAEAGIAAGQGIAVDCYQQASLQDVYAAGDICQVKDKLTGRAVIPGRWDTAVAQGRVAGYNMAGAKRAGSEYIAMHAGQYGSLPVVTLGLGNAKPDREYRIYTLAQPERGLYRRLVFLNGRLVGAIFLGDVSRAGVLAALIRSGKEVVREAPEMLKGRLPVTLPLAGRRKE
ncbi:MAG: FAD-dependent oxidoreductase, partial [Moorella sp. (in: Bacteria)]|nr:FAD-dependent oxidoreductase [Moorella sp. (in: firmicutes)]